MQKDNTHAGIVTWDCLPTELEKFSRTPVWGMLKNPAKPHLQQKQPALPRDQRAILLKRVNCPGKYLPIPIN